MNLQNDACSLIITDLYFELLPHRLNIFWLLRLQICWKHSSHIILCISSNFKSQQWHSYNFCQLLSGITLFANDFDLSFRVHKTFAGQQIKFLLFSFLTLHYLLLGYSNFVSNLFIFLILMIPN